MYISFTSQETRLTCINDDISGNNILLCFENLAFESDHK